MIKDLRRNPAHVSPLGFIVNKTSHHLHVRNTKRSSAFTTHRWLSVLECDGKLCVTVSLYDAMTDSKQMSNGFSFDSEYHKTIQYYIVSKGIISKVTD